VRCPYCGGECQLEPGAKLVPVEQLNNSQRVARAVQGRAAQAFHSSAHWIKDAAGEWVPVQEQKQPAAPQTDEIYIPARNMTREADVDVPLRQSFYSGVYWFLLSGGVVVGVDTLHPLGIDVPLPLVWPPMVALVASAREWFSGLALSRDLVWRIERRINRDLTNDNIIGPPPRQPGRIVIQPQQEPLPRSWFELNANQQQEDIYHFAQIVWERQRRGENSNGQKALRGTPLPSGFDIKDDIHKAILDDLDRAGVIRWAGSGWELAAPPAAVRNRIRAEEW
jgi:hypothetical protein